MYSNVFLSSLFSSRRLGKQSFVFHSAVLVSHSYPVPARREMDYREGCTHNRLWSTLCRHRSYCYNERDGHEIIVVGKNTLLLFINLLLKLYLTSMSLLMLNSNVIFFFVGGGGGGIA